MMRSLQLVSFALCGICVEAFVHHTRRNPSFLSSHFAARSYRLAATRQEQIDLEEDYDDGDIYEPCTKTFQDFQEELEALAFLSSVDRNAARRSQQVFDEMYEAHVLEDRMDLWPNVTIYNLLIDAHAWSRDRNGGSRAEHILDRMEDGSVEEIARPNVDTYIKVMEAWANRKQPERAKQVFERLKQRYKLTKQPDVKPNTGAYNKLIKAWMKSGRNDAGESAQVVLRDMLDRYQNGDEAVKPNKKTWVQVMKAHGEQKTPEGIEAIQDLLRDMARLYRTMGEEDYRPDTQCYNVLIKTIGQTQDIPDSPNQAMDVLSELIEAYEDGNDDLRPNGATFVNVYNAFRSSNDPNSAADQVEKLLQIQEDMSSGKGDDVKPDVRAYNAVITVIARSKDPNKAVRAKRILDRMKDLQKTDESIAPNLRTYNNILNACAYTTGEPKKLMAAFRVAVGVINDLRESKALTPDPISYGLFLKSCAQLMPPNDKREAVVENIFRKCSSEGQVGKYVLHELSNAASPRLCRKLLGGDVEQGVNLPIKWSRNVQNRRQKLR